MLSRGDKGTILQLVNMHDDGNIEVEFNLDKMIAKEHKFGFNSRDLKIVGFS